MSDSIQSNASHLKRISLTHTEPAAYQAMSVLEEYGSTTQIEPTLRHLIKLRASVINGCSYCIDMHVKEALRDGDTTERLSLISVFREVAHFTSREKAALKLVDELTLVHQQGLTDATYAEVAQHFSPQETVQLCMLTVTINGWNRLAKAADMVPSLPATLAQQG